GTPSFMAAEYQDRRHYFVPRRPSKSRERRARLSAMVPFGKKAAKSTPSKFFTFNFYHDLESVFWILFWFLHHRIPIAISEDEDHIRQHINSVAASAQELIYCGITGTPGRAQLVREDEDTLMARLQCLMDLYGPLAGVVLPAMMLLDVTDAYQAIESTTPVRGADGAPKHWNAALFTEVPYREVEEGFNKLLAIIEGELKQYGDIPVTNLNLSLC
ncbi:hypothetical protein DXG03_002589, partial [Asterophora parasitica]